MGPAHPSTAVAALTPPLDGDLVLIAASAVLGWAGLMGNIRGYQTASAAAVATIAGSTSIPFNYAYQVFLFNQPIDGLSVLGAALVVGTTIGMTVVKHLAAVRAAAKTEPGAA